MIKSPYAVLVPYKLYFSRRNQKRSVFRKVVSLQKCIASQTLQCDSKLSFSYTFIYNDYCRHQHMYLLPITELREQNETNKIKGKTCFVHSHAPLALTGPIIFYECFFNDCFSICVLYSKNKVPSLNYEFWACLLVL